MKIFLPILALSLAVATPALAAKAKPPANAAAPAASAKNNMDIAAIVGEEAISSYDVDNRIAFIIVTAKLSNTPDVINHIRPQVIRSLVDEKLEMQEAKKNDITITDKDVEKAIAAIEQERDMPSGTINHILEDNHIPRDTFTSQIRAQLAWSKLLSKKIRPLVKVSDAEVQLASKRISAAPAGAKTQELQIAVIALPVDKQPREAEVRRLADKLVKEVRSGASFEEVARQFSSETANAGGKVEPFWIKPDQLDPAIGKSLATAKTGMITDPIRTESGYTIVKVYDARAAAGDEAADEDILLKEILLKLKPDAGTKEASLMLQIGEEVAKHPGTCEEKGIASIGDLQDFDIEVNFRSGLLSDLPPALKIIAGNLKTGDISTPFASAEGIRLYMLCGRKPAGSQTPDREQVISMLQQQKMELEAQKYLRNLRRETFVDVR